MSKFKLTAIILGIIGSSLLIIQGIRTIIGNLNHIYFQIAEKLALVISIIVIIVSIINLITILFISKKPRLCESILIMNIIVLISLFIIGYLFQCANGHEPLSVCGPDFSIFLGFILIIVSGLLSNKVADDPSG